ncbi:MAG: molybdopterin-synthase adenylyltransferase MoeB [Halioglobus sp.]
MLSDTQLLRYNRQILINDFDVDGQEKLQAGRVLVVGLGGLGCPAAMYLAVAGVGQLLLADGDVVELSNLQRQIAHTDADIGENKALSAAATLATLNSDTEIDVVDEHLDATTLATLVSRVDVVLDATDNYPIRFALNRACIAAAVPLVSAAAVRSEGQLSVFDPARGGPCYRCLYDESGDAGALSCSESGVLAPVVGAFGTLQAMEVLKLLSGYGEPLRGRLLVMDLRSMDIRTLTLAPRAGCPDCGQR